MKDRRFVPILTVTRLPPLSPLTHALMTFPPLLSSPQLPHANLYDFKGRMDVYRGNDQPATTSLATDNLLLRGARLRNTAWVYGERRERKGGRERGKEEGGEK